MPLFWFLLGAVFGAAVALLLSPLPSPELRTRIGERTEWDRALEEMRKVRQALEKTREETEEPGEESEEVTEEK
jgi:gas vesicle protein